MSIFKTTTASASTITTNGSTTGAYTPSVEAVVSEGFLVPGTRVTNPGVFTAGTPSEGSIIQIDNNS